MIYVFFRITAFFLGANVIFPKGTPKIFKVTFSIVLAFLIGLSVDLDLSIATSYEFIKYAVSETINGLILGYMVSLCFYSLKIAGKLIDNQIGLSMASTYDPNTQSQSTIMENLIYFIGITMFFSLNAHHILIRSIQQSFELIPIGYSIISYNISYILKVFIEYFIIGIKVASPIVLILVITDLLTGIISRSISGLNVMIIGMPLKMLVGILFFISVLPFMINGIQDIFKGLKDVLDGTFAFKDNILMVLEVFIKIT